MQRFEVYCDGKVVYKVEGKNEYPFPFNMAVDAAMTYLNSKPYGTLAMFLDEEHRLIGTTTSTAYTPCPWTIAINKGQVLGGDGGR